MKRQSPTSGMTLLLLLAAIVIGLLFYLFFLRLAPQQTIPMTAPPPIATTGIAPVATSDPARQKPAPWAGIIADALAQPIAGATIELITTEDGVAHSTLSDDLGRFILLLPQGQQPFVSIRADGFYQVQVQLGSDPNEVYVLFRGGTLRGNVLGHVFVLSGEEMPPPEPIVGATVEIAGGGGWHISVTTDSSGKYSVAIPPGRIIVTVRSKFHADARFDNLEVGRGEVLERDFILPAGVTLDAFVFSNEIPLIGARVRVFNEIKDEAEGFSASDGKARIPGLAAGVAKVQVVHPGYQEQIFEMIIPSDKIGVRRPYLMKKSQPFQIEVFDKDQHLLTDARVRIRRDRIEVVDTNAGDLEALSVLASGNTYMIEVRHSVKTESGEVILPPRTFRYTMPEEGPGQLSVELRPGGRITGVILAPNRYPVPGATVLIKAVGLDPGEAPPPRLVKSGNNGLFRSQPFTAGNWNISISHPQLGAMVLETSVEEGKDRSLGELVFPIR
ncbi:MAG: carboxypeptidase-like regulatory domain-containing protein [Planctomycetota bacterium]|nr:carboxypeptidase-like regulatory domain-containing protein [Planctomycetota bacterium]